MEEYKMGMNLKQSGIYQIRNLVNGKVYVGSAVNIERRLYRHKYQLHNNKHDNEYLQRSWNKYGENIFAFEVLEFVKDAEVLLEREQYWLDLFKSYVRENGYNICPKAGNSSGTRHSEETKRLIGQRSKERNAVEVMNKTLKRNNIQRKPRKKKPLKEGCSSINTKIDYQQAKLIKLLLRDTNLLHVEISELVNATKDIVTNINLNKTWKHVKITPNDNLNEELLEKVDFIKENRIVKYKPKKLTDEEVCEIKRLCAEGKVYRKEIAKMFGIGKTLLFEILRGEKYSHIN
jgi:group I intron endonuclease